jgi:cyclase
MKRALCLGIALVVVIPVILGAQVAEYPITVVPTGKGPYTFPDGYRTPFDKVEIMVTEKLSPNLYVLHGSAGVDTSHPDASGGRVLVLFGPEGILMVDTQNAPVAEKTLKAIRTFSNAPIKIVVNSHFHSDHTGGNAFFGKQGAMIYSQENLREELVHPASRADGTTPPAMDPAGVPAVTYQYNASASGAPAVTIRMNDEIVDFIPMMPSHTAGDTITRFRNANVIYIEDFYRNFGYPFADQANGGTLKGMLDAIDLIQKIADDNTILVPGHGTLVHRKDLLGYRAMVVDILARVKTMRSSGKMLKDVLAANLTAPYEKVTLGDTQVSKDRFITEAFLEANGLPPVVGGKRSMPRPE